MPNNCRLHGRKKRNLFREIPFLDRNGAKYSRRRLSEAESRLRNAMTPEHDDDRPRHRMGLVARLQTRNRQKIVQIRVEILCGGLAGVGHGQFGTPSHEIDSHAIECRLTSFNFSNTGEHLFGHMSEHNALRSHAGNLCL